MYFLIALLMIAGIIVLAYYLLGNKEKETSHEATVSIPNPMTDNEFLFYNWVQHDPFLKESYRALKQKNVPIKPEYEAAIKKKIETGSFDNPYKFPYYFDSKFDYIVMNFDIVTEDPKSAYEVGFAYVKDDTLVYSESYTLNPARGIVQLRKKQWALLRRVDENFSIYYNFKQLWDYILSSYCNDNLLVFPYYSDFETFQALVNFFKIENVHIQYLLLRDLTKKFRELSFDIAEAATEFGIKGHREDRVKDRAVLCAQMMGEMIDNDPDYVENISVWVSPYPKRRKK